MTSSRAAVGAEAAVGMGDVVAVAAVRDDRRDVRVVVDLA
jgi:hypothetical protein